MAMPPPHAKAAPVTAKVKVDDLRLSQRMIRPARTRVSGRTISIMI